MPPPPRTRNDDAPAGQDSDRALSAPGRQQHMRSLLRKSSREPKPRPAMQRRSQIILKMKLLDLIRAERQPIPFV